MAIFDSEKRPRGLRVPSLTAMKNGTAASVSQFSFHRKNSNEARTPEEATPTLASSYPAPAPPPTKELPVPPKKELPPRPQISSKVPPRRAVGSNSSRPNETSAVSASSTSPPQGIRPAASPVVSSLPPKNEQPLPPTPSRGLRQAGPITTTVTTSSTPTSPQPEQEAPSPSTIKASQGIRPAEPTIATPVSPQPEPAPVFSPAPASIPVQHVQPLPPTPPTAPQISQSPELVSPAPSRPVQQAPPVHALPPTPPPVTLSPPPGEAESGTLTPLEDFIPTPDGASTPLEQMSSNEQAPPGLTPPPDSEPATAPLNTVHYVCFQEHRNMPVSQNVWCPTLCMTCHKNDREIRYRCVHCCLRICEGCHGLLQKGKNRSLADLMRTLEK
ncbi:hypothetical protein N7532_011038 [Penicillium argentinense]|uniref:Uncharacterized protein n=1 Tax=Penicillium argentinense TaxID=1131581 RepID=A0A9W9EHT4_9EURO|nr:uncharacterized protein N7532_011038 [Penicillium argentinense]KAJ5081995.1 hypothetical protein N7532_011038 [Penicillium argentinense]